MKHITKDNLSDFAFVNADTVKYPIKGVCTCFHGYTDGTFITESNKFAKMLGEKGIVYVFPYYSVWAWFSDNALELIEQVLDATYEKFGLSDSVPLCVSGGSMGGLTSLLYTVYGRRAVVGCASDCPVTDMRHFYKTHPMDRRSVMDAHINKNIPFDIVLENLSPVCICDRFPKIPYYAVFGGADPCITAETYIPFGEAMKKAGADYKCSVVDGMGHCGLNAFDSDLEKYVDFIDGVISK